ncbi:MAG: PEGA domain-containing protein, partial [Betaproteobacteria bacterium]
AALASVVVLAIAVASYVIDSRAPPAHVAAPRTAPALQTTTPTTPAIGSATQQPVATAPLLAGAAPPSQLDAIQSKLEAAPRASSRSISPVRRPAVRTVPAPKASEPNDADAGSTKAANDAWRTPAGTQAKEKTAALAPTAVAPPTPSKAAARATALITLAISPWGEVFVDGVSTAVSPPISELELTPGSHRIEIRNGEFKPYLETFQLEANQTVRIRHKFAQR